MDFKSHSDRNDFLANGDSDNHFGSRLWFQVRTEGLKWLIGDIVMLVSWRWWQFIDVGYWISMLMTSVECWCRRLMKRKFVTKMVKKVINIFKLSLTHFVSNIRHQHRFSVITILKFVRHFLNFASRFFFVSAIPFRKMPL